MPHARRFRLAVAPLAVAAALGFAACGGDDEEDTIPLADWVEQADAICAETNDRLDAELEEYFGGNVPDQPPTGEELEEVATEVFVPVQLDQLERLRDLPEPEEEADKVDEALLLVREGTNALAENPELIADPEGPEEFQQANEIARELGLEECGQ